METPLNNYRIWIEIKNHGPIEVKIIAEALIKLRDKINYISTNNIEKSIEDIFESHTILNYIVSEFCSLFQHSEELLKKEVRDEEIVKLIITDLTNMNNKIETETASLTFKLTERFYPALIFKIKHLLSESIDTLIGPVLIKSYLIKKEFGDDFLETLNKETKRLAGLHPSFVVFKKQITPINTLGYKKDVIHGILQGIKQKEGENSEQTNDKMSLDFDFPEYDDELSNLSQDETI